MHIVVEVNSINCGHCSWRREEIPSLVGVGRSEQDGSKPVNEAHTLVACTTVPEARPGLQELDRARIARTIHDHFGLFIMLLRTQLQAAKVHLNSVSPDEYTATFKTAAEKDLAAAEILLRQLSDAARQLQNDLHPAPLDSHGLAVAFVALQATFAGAGLNVTFHADVLANRRFSKVFETTAYWLTQHALTNVLRHSGTDQATVTTAFESSPGQEVLRIVIEDRGKGFLLGQIGSTFGFTVMYERAALLGGTVTVDSVLEQGTRVAVALPLNPETA